MPKVTIIPSDGIVIVDGRGFKVDLSTPGNVHAIQWDGVNGWVEYNDGKLNAPVTQADYDSLVVPAIAAWEVARAAADAPLPPPNPAVTRRAEILRGLYAIDMQSVRPVRAKLAGTATAEDDARLASLEAQAQTLRTELEGI